MLTQTNSGNWAKEIAVTTGGKWRFVGNFSSLEAAEGAASVQESKGRKARVIEAQTSKSGAKKLHERTVAKAVEQATSEGKRGEELRAVAASVLPLPIGAIYWRVEAYITHHKQALTHASAAECEAAGKVPGKCNV